VGGSFTCQGSGSRFKLRIREKLRHRRKRNVLDNSLLQKEKKAPVGNTSLKGDHTEVSAKRLTEGKKTIYAYARK